MIEGERVRAVTKEEMRDTDRKRRRRRVKERKMEGRRGIKFKERADGVVNGKGRT